jgi:hypothetical protein
MASGASNSCVAAHRATRRAVGMALVPCHPAEIQQRLDGHSVDRQDCPVAHPHSCIAVPDDLRLRTKSAIHTAYQRLA